MKSVFEKSSSFKYPGIQINLSYLLMWVEGGEPFADIPNQPAVYVIEDY